MNPRHPGILLIPFACQCQISSNQHLSLKWGYQRNSARKILCEAAKSDVVTHFIKLKVTSYVDYPYKDLSGLHIQKSKTFDVLLWCEALCDLAQHGFPPERAINIERPVTDALHDGPTFEWVIQERGDFYYEQALEGKNSDISYHIGGGGLAIVARAWRLHLGSSLKLGMSSRFWHWSCLAASREEKYYKNKTTYEKIHSL